MKKKILITITIISILLNGCVNKKEMKKETLNFADNKVDLEEVKEYEEFVKTIDFSNSHIEAEIKENLMLDADITVNVPLTMGIYEYDDIGAQYVYNEEERYKKVEKLAGLVDEYFEEDVTVTFSEQGEANTTESQYVNAENEKYFAATQWEVLPVDVTTNYRCKIYPYY